MAMYLIAFLVAVSLLGAIAVLFVGALFGGVFFGGLSKERTAEKNVPVAPPKVAEVPGLIGWPPDLALSDELLLRQIEHHLRREALIAEQFIQNPSPETLRAGNQALRVH